MYIRFSLPCSSINLVWMAELGGDVLMKYQSTFVNRDVDGDCSFAETHGHFSPYLTELFSK